MLHGENVKCECRKIIKKNVKNNQDKYVVFYQLQFNVQFSWPYFMYDRILNYRFRSKFITENSFSNLHFSASLTTTVYDVNFMIRFRFPARLKIQRFTKRSKRYFRNWDMQNRPRIHNDHALFTKLVGKRHS